jgi:hypothetical protein
MRGRHHDPKVYDRVTLQSVRDTFHETWKSLTNIMGLPVANQHMKAGIIERRPYLANHGMPEINGRLKY